MLFVLRFFITRIPREGFRSLAVPMLSAVLCILINMMGGAVSRQTADLEDVLLTFEVRVVASDPVSSAVDKLDVREEYISLFTDPAAPSSLAGFLKDVQLKRYLNIWLDPPPVEEAPQVDRPPDDGAGPIPADGGPHGSEDRPHDSYAGLAPAGGLPVSIGGLVGITSENAAAGLNPLLGAYIGYFEGYDEGIFRTGQHVCVVNEEIFGTLDPNNPTITLYVQSTEQIRQPVETVDEDGEPVLIWESVPADLIEAEFLVVGLIYGAGNDIYCPFWAASALGTVSDGQPEYSEVLGAVVDGNLRIGELKTAARAHFVAAGVVDERKPFSLTVFDGAFNDVTDRLSRSISMMETATPFVYAVSACIGFVASFLIARRRKPEFAVMRSVGIRRADIFLGALTEQAALGLAGVITGGVLFSIFSGTANPAHSSIFWACYTLGAAIPAAKSAGTDVLKILRAQ